MKKIFLILCVAALLGSCKTASIFAMRPDKESFSSGTIGSANETNNLPPERLNEAPPVKDSVK